MIHGQRGVQESHEQMDTAAQHPPHPTALHCSCGGCHSQSVQTGGRKAAQSRLAVVTEICEFDFPCVTDEQVSWLQISVQNEVGVAVLDRPQDHDEERLHIGDREEDISLV